MNAIKQELVKLQEQLLVNKILEKEELVKLLEQLHGELMVKYCWGEPWQVSERWLLSRMRRIEKRLPHLAPESGPTSSASRSQENSVSSQRSPRGRE